MSADLFAEFGSTPAPSEGHKPPGITGDQSAPTFSFFDNLSAHVTSAPPQTLQSVSHSSQWGNQGSVGNQANDEEDDWGDFEGGNLAFEQAANRTQEDPFALSTPVSQTAIPAQTAPANSDVFSFSSTGPSGPVETTWQRAPVIKAKKSADPSVLFDAEDDFGDDDFGDFEDSEQKQSTANAAPPTGMADLLGDLSLTGQSHSASNDPKDQMHPKAPSQSTLLSPTGGFGLIARTKQPEPTGVSPGQKDDDSWDTFDDWEASIPTKKADKPLGNPKEKQTRSESTLGVPAPILSPTTGDVQPGELPPTNVPPPAVLLTLFPPLFAEAQTKLFKPMTAQALPMRNKLLSEPGTVMFLQGYLMLVSVAAHIIAGRKLRWKRDQHLSQGMRIGPASSRATSGMKLSSIDKSESMKEEREVSDVVRAWKEQVGKVRHVVSAANQVKSGTLGLVPDLLETMAVRVLKQSEGGVPAPQACMLCGLKRDERVGAADQGVEDSFGEWWIEQVNMHRSTSPSSVVTRRDC